MTSTFYGVLGVGPGADADAIREGYRERVKDVHPDVNDDADADAQFQRLTTARDVLLDAAERARYDRLGHVSYIRHHVDCSAWTGTCPPDDSHSTDRGTDSTSSAGTTETGQASDASADAGRSSGSSTAGVTDSGTGTASASTGSGPSRSSRSGSTASGGSGSAGSGNGSQRQRRARSADSPGSYATSSFWEARSSGAYERRTSESPSLLGRFVRGLRALGPWVFIHVAFIAVAVGTCLYAYSVVLDGSSVSLPVLLVLIGEVGLAVILSSIHVLSRLSR